MTTSLSRRTLAERSVRGFTVLELMLTVAIAAIVSAVVAPTLREFAHESRLRSTAGELVTDLNFARLEAIKRNARVLVCAKDAASKGCSATAEWQYGWVVCYDADADNACDETSATDPNPLKVVSATGKGVALTGTAALIRFNPVGTSNGAAALTVSGPQSDSTTRTAHVAGTGFITSTKN